MASQVVFAVGFMSGIKLSFYIIIHIINVLLFSLEAL